jgi:threonine dehydrogenase-like Zn-dependent dehydrogenase
LCRINIPEIIEHEGSGEPVATGEVVHELKEGDKITKKELLDYGQSEEDIERLVKADALKEV